MVEIEDVSRELCGGTHVAATSEIGLFHVTTETSSASNVRRIEAVTGAEAARLFQERTERLNEIAARLKVPEHELVNAVERLSARVKELEKGPKAGAEVDVSALAERATRQDEVLVLVEALPGLDSNTLRDISDNVRQKLGDAVVMLGSESDGRVHLVANVSPSVVERGVSAADLVKTAAPIVGGGGGGRDTLAQAGGKDPDRLGEALEAARAEIEKALA
jgi:alanyl-tRNA synthetase